MTTYRLQSSPIIWAPGVVWFAQHVFSKPWKDEHKMALDMIRCWNLPEDVVDALVRCKLELEVDEVEGTVTFRI